MKKYTIEKNKIRLPKQIIDDVERLDLSGINKSHSIKFISLLINHSFRDYGDIFSHTSKSKEYLKKTFSAGYNVWLNQLIDKQIITRTNYYYTGISYYYSLNIKYNLTPSISSSSILWVKTFINDIKIIDYKEKIYTTEQGIRDYYKWFSDDMNSLNINYDELYKIVDDKVNNITIESLGYSVDDNKLKSSLKVNGIGNKYYTNTYMKRSQLVSISQENNYTIIQTPQGCYLDDLVHFINKKKFSIYLSYLNSLDSLKDKNYRVNRNETNRRLDTNLTNLYSELVDEICRQNDLVQIDLSNSQFCFLSHLLNKKLDTPDNTLFRWLSYNGNLYTYVQEKLNLKSLKESKLLMFSLLFSSEKNTTTQKKILKSLFPSVIDWVDRFKKENGYKKFSVELQKIESNLFIDVLLNKIKTKKLFCLTKHDSLIIRRNDYEPIMEIVTKTSNEIGFGGVFRSDFNCDYKKLEVIGYVPKILTTEI